MALRVETIDLDEAATFFAKRGDDGQEFNRLSRALRHAMAVEVEARDSTANIVTESGTKYGWDEIATLYEHARLIRSLGSPFR